VEVERASTHFELQQRHHRLGPTGFLQVDDTWHGTCRSGFATAPAPLQLTLEPGADAAFGTHLSGTVPCDIACDICDEAGEAGEACTDCDTWCSVLTDHHQSHHVDDTQQEPADTIPLVLYLPTLRSTTAEDPWFDATYLPDAPCAWAPIDSFSQWNGYGLRDGEESTAAHRHNHIARGFLVAAPGGRIRGF